MRMESAWRRLCRHLLQARKREKVSVRGRKRGKENGCE